MNKPKQLPPELTQTVDLQRQTNETRITLKVSRDTSLPTRIQTGVGFFDHMLAQIARHAGVCLEIETQGDIEVDAHHTVEDTGIVLGMALKELVGDARGINRYGFFSLPMEESLADVSLDICGRGYLVYNVPEHSGMCGEFPFELGREFFLAVTRSAGITAHFNLRYGCNQHHILEALFKGFGKALGVALASSGSDQILSTKGTLS